MIHDDSQVKDDDFIVRVKAQVMTRDEGTGGWVPFGKGGMSIIGLRRVTIADRDDVTTEYLLHGQRIADKSNVLNCLLKKDLQYTKANPTFHHWRTENERFGLTFQSSADARLLERSICKAMENILTPQEDSNIDYQITDDDVFMKDDSLSLSVSTASTAASSPVQPSPPAPVYFNSTQAHTPSHSKAQYVNWLCTGSRNRTVANDTGHSINSTEITIEHPQSIEPDIEMVDYSYVQLAKTRTAKHDYTYPSLDIIAKVATTSTQSSNQVALEKYNSTGSLRRVSINEISNLGAPPAVPLPLKIRSKRKDVFRKPASRRLTSGARSRCIYCHEVFAQEENWRGSCRDAPDESARCIEKLSCMCCVQAVLYHCMSDSDGVYHHPCSCDSSDRNNGRRWVAMAFLSLIVPCLWCYLPLKICHACGTRCRCCGGRHKSA